MNWEPKKLPVDLLYCSGIELEVSLRSQFTYLQKKKGYIIYPGLSLLINKIIILNKLLTVLLLCYKRKDDTVVNYDEAAHPDQMTNFNTVK